MGQMRRGGRCQKRRIDEASKSTVGVLLWLLAMPQGAVLSAISCTFSSVALCHAVRTRPLLSTLRYVVITPPHPDPHFTSDIIVSRPPLCLTHTSNHIGVLSAQVLGTYWTLVSLSSTPSSSDRSRPPLTTPDASASSTSGPSFHSTLNNPTKPQVLPRARPALISVCTEEGARPDLIPPEPTWFDTLGTFRRLHRERLHDVGRDHTREPAWFSS